MAAHVVSRELLPVRRAHAPYEVTVARDAPDPAWDAFLEGISGSHHVQSAAWAEVKRIAGWRSARVVARQNGRIRGGCQVLLRDVPYAGAIAYAPRGPVLQHGGAALVAAVFDGLDALAREERVLMLKLQPPVERRNVTAILAAGGWVPSGLEAAPTATVRVDVQRPPAQILHEMRPRVRTYIRRGERSELRVRAGTYADLQAFAGLVEATARRHGFARYTLRYYQEIWRAFTPDRLRLVLVEHEEAVLTGLLLIGFGDSVVYAIGGWCGTHAHMHPNELAHWVGMAWARDRGHRYYDFAGIDPVVAHALVSGTARVPVADGVTRFKLGFGGRVVLFPPAYDRAYRQLLTYPVRWLAPRLRSWSLGHLAQRFSGRAVGSV